MLTILCWPVDLQRGKAGGRGWMERVWWSRFSRIRRWSLLMGSLHNIMITVWWSQQCYDHSMMMTIQALQNIAMNSFDGISAQEFGCEGSKTWIILDLRQLHNAPPPPKKKKKMYLRDIFLLPTLPNICGLRSGFYQLCSLLCLPSVNYVKTVKSNFWIEMSFCVKTLKRLHLQTRSRVIWFAHWTLFVFLYLSHFLHILLL